MEVNGSIKRINETKTYGESGFRKREMVLTTKDQYPQMLNIEFVQDKCDILDKYKVDDEVKISINLTGREWINPQGEAVYFNAIQGWRIEKMEGMQTPPPLAPVGDALNESNEVSDIPF